jgi:hypothetical protein
MFFIKIIYHTYFYSKHDTTTNILPAYIKKKLSHHIALLYINFIKNCQLHAYVLFLLLQCNTHFYHKHDNYNIIIVCNSKDIQSEKLYIYGYLYFDI